MSYYSINEIASMLEVSPDSVRKSAVDNKWEKIRGQRNTWLYKIGDDNARTRRSKTAHDRSIYYCQKRSSWIVPLTKGCEAMIDAESIPLVAGQRWQALDCMNTIYAKCKNQSMHRCLTRAQKGQVVDHLNGDGLDNRLHNLRLGIQRINTQNQRRHRSGEMVGAHYACNGWSSYIRVGGRSIALGSFSSKEEASSAYWAAIRRLVCAGPRTDRLLNQYNDMDIVCSLK